MQPIHAWIRLWAVVQTLAVLFQILSKQTSIIAAAVHKNVSVLPGERRWGLGGDQAAVHFAFKPTGEEAPALPPPVPQAHTGSLLNEYTSNHLILGGAAPFDFVHGGATTRTAS